MKPDWHFETRRATDVEQDVTQRDQFNNDEVTLGEAIVREVIQNSTDAAANGAPVKVRFQVHELNGKDVTTFKGLFDSLRPHLAAAKIGTASIDGANPRLLVVEDFGTKGLEGDPGAHDALHGKNFYSFWRAHGKSGKTGKAGGRWGLGKLVYSSASEIRAFFGLTLRAGDAAPLLMGQAVLTNHDIGNSRYLPHGFWFGERGEEDIQLPLSDAGTVAPLASLWGVTRTAQTGLSLVVPCLHPAIDDGVLLRGVVRNYYFPILAGKLVVEVGSTVVDRESFLTVAAETLGAAEYDRTQFAFIDQVSRTMNQPPAFAATRSLYDDRPIAGLFEPEVISQMQTDFAGGKLLHVRVPVRLRPRTGGETETSIDLFLKPLPENARPFGLFARSSITVPAEARRYFGGAYAYGAMVATDKEIVTFLGDAENPAHTGWNSTAEKLLADWRNPAPTLKGVRHALRSLYEGVSGQQEREDKHALIDFFSLADAARSSKGKKKRTPVPPPEIPASEKAMRIRKHGAGSFALIPAPGADKWTFPKTVRVRVAYDILGGNPFKSHSKFDFDLTGKAIALTAENMTVKPLQANVLQLSINSKDFRLEATGFDPNRDIVVDARTVP